MAVRTFPATTYPTPPPSITPPDSPPRRHHTATTFRDFYNSEFLYQAVTTGSLLCPGGHLSQPAAYRGDSYKYLHGCWDIG